MKKVSIVLPTYNGARYLCESIKSCLEQTYSEIELVIVDDCSMDQTPQILLVYEDDPRVKIIRHAVNLKLPAALNTGFAHTSGDYLTWTSDDNMFAPSAIKRMVNYLEKHPDVRFVYTDYWLIDKDGRTIRRVSAEPPEHLRERCAVACFLYHREVYEDVGDYDPHLFRIEDYDYWLRVVQRFKLGYLPEALYYYRRHSSSLTRTDQLDNRVRMFDELLTKYFGPDPNRLARTLSQYYISEAFESHFCGDRLDVLRHAARAIGKDVSFLMNRGVLSIVLQALFGETVMRGLRRLAKPMMSYKRHNINR